MSDLSSERRKLDRKEEARKRAWKRIANAKERIERREKMRSNVGQMPRDRLVNELKALITNEDFEKNLKDRTTEQLRNALRERLTNHIKDDKREVANNEERLKRITRIMGNTREDIRTLIRERRRRRKKKREGSIDESPGSPHWGGSADIFAQEVTPAAGVAPHSTKRTVTFGNPGSDHYIGNVVAYAGDYPPSITRAINIAEELGIGYDGYGDDYVDYFISRDGHTYRVEIIAQNHGTGPHVHVGIERIN